MFYPIIETAIGLIFVYLLLSMICSALQEWLAAVLRWRARMLFKGITEMLCGDTNFRDELYDHPMIRGLADDTLPLPGAAKKKRKQSTANGNTQGAAHESAPPSNAGATTPAEPTSTTPPPTNYPTPSYIAPETFAKAFLSVADVTSDKIAGRTKFTHTWTGAPLHQNTQDLLDSFVQTTSGTIDDVRQAVAAWFEDAMDRVSGWYKRQTHLVLLLIAFLVALLFNADTFMLSRAFWTDPVLRANTVAAAEQWIKTHPNGPGQSTSTTDSQQTAPGTQNAAAPIPKSTQPDIAADFPSTTMGQSDTPPPPEPAYSPEQLARAEAEYRAASANLKTTTSEVTGTLAALKVPLGWCFAPDQPAAVEEEDTGDPTATSAIEAAPEQPESPSTEVTEANPAPGSPASFILAGAVCDPEHQPPQSWSAAGLKLLGLLITMVALSQGAPFWFDLLKKVVNLRLAGDAPNEKKKAA